MRVRTPAHFEMFTMNSGTFPELNKENSCMETKREGTFRLIWTCSRRQTVFWWILAHPFMRHVQHKQRRLQKCVAGQSIARRLYWPNMCWSWSKTIWIFKRSLAKSWLKAEINPMKLYLKTPYINLWQVSGHDKIQCFRRKQLQDVPHVLHVRGG